MRVAAQIRFSSLIWPGPELPGRLPQRRAGRPQRAEHQRAPHQQADKKADLPEAAELDVGQALIAEPEPRVAHISHDAEPVPDQRAGNDDQRHPEQQIDQQTLAARLALAGDRRREKQAGADPPDADPDDRSLDVHVAQEVERQIMMQFEPVEAAAIVIGMRHDRAGEDLQQQHRRDDEKVFADLPLARVSGRNVPSTGSIGPWSAPLSQY